MSLGVGDQLICGFAASRAESLRLSVKAATGLAATPPEAKPLLILETNGKPEAFRTGGGKAANVKSAFGNWKSARSSALHPLHDLRVVIEDPRHRIWIRLERPNVVIESSTKHDAIATWKHVATHPEVAVVDLWLR